MRITIAVALLSSVCSAASPARRTASRHAGPLAEAEKLLSSGDVNGAISSLDRLVGASPRCSTRALPSAARWIWTAATPTRAGISKRR